MTKNPFKSIGKIFTKGANKIGNTAKSIFSKNNMNTFRDHLSDTLQSQGKILSTVGKITTGLALNPITLGAVGAFAPELLPVVLGVGAMGAGIGGVGMLESSGGNLLKPKLYKGKNGLQTTGAVVNQIEKAGKGVAQVAKFA